MAQGGAHLRHSADVGMLHGPQREQDGACGVLDLGQVVIKFCREGQSMHPEFEIDAAIVAKLAPRCFEELPRRHHGGVWIYVPQLVLDEGLHRWIGAVLDGKSGRGVRHDQPSPWISPFAFIWIMRRLSLAYSSSAWSLDKCGNEIAATCRSSWFNVICDGLR
jgi:hypothetical protein